MVYRIRVLDGGLELNFPWAQVRAPTAPAELGVLMVMALRPRREVAIAAFKRALFDEDPALISDGAIHTPISRLRRAGIPIPPRRYALDVDPSEVDIVDVDLRARTFIEAAGDLAQLDAQAVRDLVESGHELHGIWRHDPGEAVGHRPSLSALFESHRRRHRRFGLAFARLLAATGETLRALEVLDDHVDRYGDDTAASSLRRQLGESMAGAAAPASPVVGARLAVQAGRGPWPVQIGRPPLRARAFQPRDELAERISVATARARTVAACPVVLVGSGGVGKTQLAAAAFARAREQGAEALMWVDASSRESVLTTYAHASTVVGSSARSDAGVEEAAERFLEWLAVTERPGSWSSTMSPRRAI